MSLSWKVEACLGDVKVPKEIVPAAHAAGDYYGVPTDYLNDDGTIDINAGIKDLGNLGGQAACAAVGAAAVAPICGYLAGEFAAWVASSLESVFASHPVDCSKWSVFPTGPSPSLALPLLQSGPTATGNAFGFWPKPPPAGPEYVSRILRLRALAGLTLAAAEASTDFDKTIALLGPDLVGWTALIRPWLVYDSTNNTTAYGDPTGNAAGMYLGSNTQLISVGQLITSALGPDKLKRYVYDSPTFWQKHSKLDPYGAAIQSDSQFFKTTFLDVGIFNRPCPGNGLMTSFSIIGTADTFYNKWLKAGPGPSHVVVWLPQALHESIYYGQPFKDLEARWATKLANPPKGMIKKKPSVSSVSSVSSDSSVGFLAVAALAGLAGWLLLRR